VSPDGKDRQGTEGFSASWSAQDVFRKGITERFPSNWRLPVRRRHSDVVLDYAKPGQNVLEIGASNRSLRDFLAGQVSGLTYRTMDVDRNTKQDFYSLEEIIGAYDLALMFEVIEHPPAPEGARILQKVFEILKPGGVCVLTTPNLFHPNRFWDTEHLTPWRYDRLGGIMLAVGFEVEYICRLHNAPGVRRWIRAHVAGPLHEFLDVDFAKSICVAARRPA